MVVGGWIFQKNLQVFLEFLGQISGTQLREWDFYAIREGLVGTDDERGARFSYKLQGEKRTLTLQAADDPGTSVFIFRIEADDSTAELIELAFFAAQASTIKPDTPFD